MTDRRAIHLKRTSFAGIKSTLVFQDDALGLQVFRSEAKTGRVVEIAFSGMRCKPDYNFSFGSHQQAEIHRTKWIEGKHAAKTAKSVRQTERQERLREGHTLVVGDVLSASWGYDQTNYEYFQVTRVFGLRSVEIRELAKEAQEHTSQAMAGVCVPMKGRFIGEPMVKRVDTDGRVKVHSWGVWASKKETTTVVGVEIFKPDSYTDYA
ncbi:hypothetical protein EIP75_21485 [Aquabacterium soli]|uniref:Uncharacterized protein n=1 Tax=Aquabacterium soli TaxID=2493092 RepID=A0A3R8RYX9_9BURK|nr:hypothetical protein [Aquabacterium soli]RRS01152.1 hypothetical protein EIP75_21485 [Aquabacterium soli]